MTNRDTHWSLLLALIVAALCVASVTGKLAVHSVDDTASYLNYPFESLSAALLSIRTPGYPVFLKLIGSTLGLPAVPVVQWIAACLAAWWLAVELGRWSATTISIWVAAFAIVFSCTFLDNQSTLSTDAIAASVGIFSVTCLLRWVRRGRKRSDGAMIVLAVIAAIMIRPAYLALLPWVLLMGTLLTSPCCDATESWLSRVRSSGFVSLGIVALIVGWMTMRLVVVQDFGLLPFGHQNLAGITIQLVDDRELLAVASRDSDARTKTLASEILKQRDQACALGVELQPGGRLATMAMEGQWNDLIYRAVAPAANQLYPDDPVANHGAIARLNRGIITAYPWRYARWLGLGTRRAVWGIAADIAMNPVFLIVAACYGVWWCGGVIRREGWRTENADPSRIVGTTTTQLMAVVALSYAIAMVGFVILTTPPLGRFADAGAIFIPAWLAVWASESVSLAMRRH